MKVINYLAKKPRAFLWFIALLLNFILGVIDYATGYEIGISILYLLPISLLSWLINEKAGIIMSVISAATTITADILTGKPILSYYTESWNILVHLSFFIIVAYLTYNLARFLTERKQIENALRESEEHYRSLFTNMLDGYAYCKMLFDGQGRPVDFLYIETNSAFEALTGLKNVAGKKISEVLPGLLEIQPAVIETYGRVVSTGRPERFELDLKLLSLWLSISVYSPQKGFFVAVFENITERKQAEDALRERTAELEKRTRQLEAANKELESFSYSVSHDLRAPLRAIDGFSGMLLKDLSGKLDEATQHRINTIQEKTREMNQLITDILEFSRLGRKDMTMTVIDMEKLATEVWGELRQNYPERKVAVNISHLTACRGDASMIRQVLGNLLTNALKFTKNRAMATIDVGGEIKEGECIYSVSDNGVGFDMRSADKLFKLFQRLHSEEEYEGTGIGLSFVKRIIDRHGGRVWAEGTVNEGATFYFSLPQDIK